jgi:peptide/nickel transport system substrate-binding protein
MERGENALTNDIVKLRRRNLKRRGLLGTAAVGGIGLTAGGLFACSSRGRNGSVGSGNGSPSSQPAQAQALPGGTFSGYLGSNFPLDPQKLSGSAHVVTGGIYSRIFKIKTSPDPKTFTNHELENDLGMSAESPDAITWTVKLRSDAKFQNIPPVNAHPVEAEDVKATFLRALDPSISNPNRGALDMLDAAQIQTPDKTTVVFKLKYPYAPFRRILASPDYSYILPREALAGSYDLSKVVIGSGPFLLDSITPDVAYTYKRNPDYFEKGRPYVDNLKLAVIPTTAAQLAQFTSGSIDELIVDNLTDLEATKKSNPNAVIVQYDNGSPAPIYFQLGDPTSPFTDIRVRRAFSMAIDRDAFAKVIFNGDSQRPVFVPSYMGKWSLQVSDLPQDIRQYFNFNPSESKKLLEAAGVKSLQLRVAYVVGGSFSPLYQKQAEMVANMLNEVGMKTNLVAQDYNKDFVDAGKGSRQGYFDKDLVLFGGASNYTEADDWLFSYFHSKSTSNQEHLSDPVYDGLVDKERTIVNEDERLKAVQEIEKYLADKMYVVSVGGAHRYAVLQPRVQGYCVTDASSKHAENYAKLWLKQ